MTEESSNQAVGGLPIGEMSDGYHTFNELYDHRITLFIALCRWMSYWGHTRIWKSKLHADGSSFDGWFIMGINTEPGMQITYHLPMDRWDEADYADAIDRAPEWDGHTPADVIARLKKLKIVAYKIPAGKYSVGEEIKIGPSPE